MAGNQHNKSYSEEHRIYENEILINTVKFIRPVNVESVQL